MMHPSVIRDMSDKAAEKAARENKTPYVPFDAREVNGWKGIPFPFIGSFQPEGWREVENLFCDATGWGSEDEPALTSRLLKEKVLEYLEKEGTYGFAITEAGQFQAYVGVFEKL